MRNLIVGDQFTVQTSVLGLDGKPDTTAYGKCTYECIEVVELEDPDTKKPEHGYVFKMIGSTGLRGFTAAQKGLKITESHKSLEKSFNAGIVEINERVD